ncbi:Ger(x)C family germination protein [Paenibacillus cellulosilyticus]|uniref:Ger(X)C family germination protein n=1 Tax=Paenibacillus cellulosilyticus TaxID=375489 RepID=A0A2V2YM05_9BACL|nr:Ger(x)C family spore germination protein [Paenibacillus cellulosilyticus]PWV95340.1 Ger(x)C family germination protein [Paenibacillus cellulosilyticus]QKS44049.1 Ger(x)C family spore germination protein [Paenibacillus cellulosilyticus]
MAPWSKLIQRMSAVLLALLCTLLLPGCWNSKDIQNLAYVTAIGIDYKNNQYITYVQVLNFSNVARTENNTIGKPVPTWIGKGEGSTVVDSLDAILATSQLRVFWGHVKTIVITENLMRKGAVEAFYALNRYREIRYRLLVYGTKERLEDIFTKKSLLNLSPLDTIMYSPDPTYDQRSFIKPVYGHQTIARINEPGQPTMVPSLTITKEVWNEDAKRAPLLSISGAYFFNEKVLSGWLSSDDLKGSRWIQKGLSQAFIQVPNKDEAVASLSLYKPKYRIRPVINGSEVRYDIEVRIKGNLSELVQNTSIPKLESMAQDVIKQEIQETYRKGIAAHCDVFNLEETLYRNYPKVWRSQHRTAPSQLSEESLRNITVKVDIRNTGKYKARVD